MPIHHLQPSFSGGEISPSLHGRADSAAYGSWLKTARNFYVHPQGGASNRPGTLFMGECKYPGKDCRIIPFVLGEEESYVLELGDRYLRVYSSGGLIHSAQGEVYEIETPYTAQDVHYINYTQYDQTLFLTHPQYPPKQLTRVESGTFSLVDVPLKYGPFMLGNTDENKKMRAVQYQDTQVSEGVSATLSFQPMIYPNLVVFAYFDDVFFFLGPNFGLDVAALVSDFNNTFGASGYKAYNLGGLVKIESPKDTGGDCNGKQLIINYHDGLARPPVLSFTQTLSGGSNKGQQIPQGENKYLLESDFDCFKPTHVKGRFALTHKVENSTAVTFVVVFIL